MACRSKLREEVSSGRLDAAESKASVLTQLCQRMQFDGDSAKALHRSIYRQRLESLLQKGSLAGTACVTNQFTCVPCTV